MCEKVSVAQSCLILWHRMNCSLPGSSIQGILQARILQWAAILFSRGSSWPRVQTQVSCIAGRLYTIWATRQVVLTIWWCPCVVSSLVLFEECVCYDQCVFWTKLLAFALLHFVLQCQTCLLLQVSLPTSVFQSPMMKKTPFFDVSSRSSHRSS